MNKQTQPISCALPPSDQDIKKPSMACQEGAEDHLTPPAPADDFEFCILSSGGLAPAGGDDAADMCVADEVFSGGKLLPLRLSSAASADASTLLLMRSDSLDGAATAASTSTTTSSSGSGFSTRSVSGSSSSCVSRSTSSNSASSDHAAVPGSSSSSSSKQSASSAADAVVLLPPRRSLSGNVFYAHPSPSPRPPPQRRSRTSAPAAAARRSTGSAPPASWGVIRLGVVGAPEVYAPRPAEYRKAARSGSRSARFELQHRTESAPADKKLAGLGLLGAGLVCSCSPDAVAPVGSAEVAAAEARRRKKKAEEKKKASMATATATATAKQSGKGTVRRSRTLEWLEDLSISKFQGEERRVVV